MAKKLVNSLIKLSPKFSKDSYHGGGGKSTFKKNDVLSTDIDEIIQNLNTLKKELEENTLPNYLITIKYKSIMSKSRRIKVIFNFNGATPFDLVVGAGYYKKQDGFLRHQITYYVTKENFENTVNNLIKAKKILNDHYNGVFKSKYMDKDSRNIQNQIFANITSMKKTIFFDLMCDVSNIDCFYRYVADVNMRENAIVSFFSIFKTTNELKSHLLSLGLSNNIVYLDNTTVIIRNEYDLETLLNKDRYIVFQALINTEECDFGNMSSEAPESFSNELSAPKNEPTIGVFDSYFDKTAYFEKWVDCVPCYPKGIDVGPNDMTHGTKVCNLIVDGPRHNKWLEDNCGNFRVKLFEVALYKRVNTEYIFENLERIVAENPDIKVWNFSLGSVYSVSMNQMSLLGAKLDYVSKKYDVIFVVSGTNYRDDYPNELKVGSPADSLNALVVNAVDENGDPTSYTRTGPVLTLYTKPDVAYYGGTDKKPILAYSPIPGDYECTGTSFAAPLISRKLAYLIHYLHLSPLVAKALIVDAAAKWDLHSNMDLKHQVGYGVVPKSIKEIIYTDSDEIKFILSDVTQEYYTKLMTIPVPLDKNRNQFLYTAKATLCSYTTGERKNGVDYSSIEMEIKLGRNIQKYRKKDDTYYTDVDSINKDKQYDEDGYVDESRACIEFQKWNNTKHLVRPIGSRRIGIKPKHGNFWGVSITQIDRLNEKTTPTNEKYGLRFGIVVTLKQILGQDAQIQSFLSECAELKLNPISVDEVYNLKLYNEENAEIKWKD